MREKLLRAVILFDWFRIRRTQQLSDFIHSFTNRDCFEQRDWAIRLLSIGLVGIAACQVVPFTVIGLFLALFNLYNATGLFLSTTHERYDDKLRREHADFINPVVISGFFCFTRTAFSWLVCFVFVVTLAATADFTLAISLITIASAALALHLDACQPRPPAPMLQLAPQGM